MPSCLVGTTCLRNWYEYRKLLRLFRMWSGGVLFLLVMCLCFISLCPVSLGGWRTYSLRCLLCMLYFLLHGLRGGNDLVAYQASILIYHNPDHNSNPGPETSSAGVPWDRCVWKGPSCCAGTCKELRPRGQTYVESILPHPRDIFCSPI